MLCQYCGVFFFFKPDWKSSWILFSFQEAWSWPKAIFSQDLWNEQQLGNWLIIRQNCRIQVGFLNQVLHNCMFNIRRDKVLKWKAQEFQKHRSKSDLAKWSNHLSKLILKKKKRLIPSCLDHWTGPNLTKHTKYSADPLGTRYTIQPSSPGQDQVQIKARLSQYRDKSHFAKQVVDLILVTTYSTLLTCLLYTHRPLY